MNADAERMVVRRSAAAPRSARLAADWRGDLALILPPFLLVGGAVLDFGAAWTEPALFCAALQCAWASALAAHYLRAPKPLRLSGLQMVAAIAFAALLTWVLFTLTPYGPFSIAEAWSLVGGAGALTMDRAATLVEFFKLAGLGTMVLAGLAIAQVERRAERAINLLLWAGGLYALWAIVSFAQHAPFTMGHEKQYHVDRLTASFLSANTAGSLFGMLAVVACVAFLRSLRAALREGRPDLRRPSPALVEAALRFALGGLFWVALLLTVSRAAAVAAALCILLVTLVEVVEMLGRRRVATSRIVGYTAPLVLGMMVVFAATVGRRFVSQFSALGSDQAGRAVIFDTYLQAIADAPLSGAGLGAFRALNAGLIDPSNFGVLWNLGAAHNIYLQWLLEGGVVGASLMALVMVFLLIDIARRRVAETGRTRATVALAASAMLLLHNTVDYSIQVPAVAALWALVLGMGAGVSSRAERRASSSSRRSRQPQERGAPGSGA